MIRNPELFGAYVFYDLNYSREHTLYPVVSPGIEFSRCQWDTRLNGYFPVSRHRKREATFLDVSDSCGSNLNTDQIVFSGHQEFVPRFANIEEVGPGGDFEIGRHFPCAHNLSLYAGAYYYRFRDFDSMKGGEARVVLPIKPAIALTVEASYDNQQHAAAIGGIRIQLGHTSRCPVLTLQDRLYEPVVRNLGNVKSGAGIPIVKGVKNEGLFLFRDNIFFFTAAGGTVFDNTLATGTFQNPLRADQFTQTNVNGIAGLAPNANLFFNTGTYIVNPTSASAPNAFLTLPVGQSMYGRTTDYRESAVGTQRPTFLGGLNLTGDNTLNSIILTNSMTGSGVISISLNTMDIESAANIFICNSDINAILEITGDNIAIQSVSALYANASGVTISNSNINASTTIMGAGESNGDSLVTCIGGNSVAGSSKNSALNIFNISNSTLSSQAIVTGSVNNSGAFATALNFATTIGGNDFQGSADFDNNQFVLNSCTLNSISTIGGSTLESVVNYATNIGGNDDGGHANFINVNQFTIIDCNLNSLVNISGNSEGTGNAVSVIGGNAVNNTAGFTSNIFTISSSNLTSTNTIGGSSDSNGNFATVIGGNEVVGNSIFDSNTFTITSCNLQSSAVVDGSTDSGNLNFATVIGGNAFGGTAEFNGNVINVNSSFLSSIARILTDNSGINSVAGIGGNSGHGGDTTFNDNVFTMNNSQIHVLGNITVANVAGGTNTAVGWEAASGTVNLISDDFFITATSGLTGGNTATDFIPGAATVNQSGTTYTVVQN